MEINHAIQLSTDLTHELGVLFEQRAFEHDRQGTFVEDNYKDLQKHGYFIALIPEELGGLGISHSTFCEHIRIIGQYCGSTALSLSMHSHLVAANVWKLRKGMGGEDVLQKVVQKELVLISTGARDFLESNGEMERVENGYLVSAMKFFASQSAYGDVVVTSAPYLDPKEGWQVLHFAVPMSADGVQVMSDWDTMGMRGTGSNTIKFDKVFIPNSAVSLKRPRGVFHPFWNAVLTLAMPLIMSAYVGIAQKAYQLAISRAQKNTSPKPHLPYQIGELFNEMVSAKTLWKDMVRIANDLDFEAIDKHSSAILARKTLVSKAVIEVVNKAIAIAGGGSFYKKSLLERLFRDVQASKFHPLQEKDQQLLIGERILESK
jgi:alkylation response protein AidB-like acyl-CoA dehydrogenase